jgi:hypothetical protein
MSIKWDSAPFVREADLKRHVKRMLSEWWGRDAASWWRHAIADGLITEQAGRAILAAPQAPSQAKPWPTALVQGVERLPLDCPMWNRAKLGPLLPAQRLKALDATVERITANRVERGVVGI